MSCSAHRPSSPSRAPRDRTDRDCCPILDHQPVPLLSLNNIACPGLTHRVTPMLFLPSPKHHGAPVPYRGDRPLLSLRLITHEGLWGQRGLYRQAPCYPWTGPGSRKEAGRGAGNTSLAQLPGPRLLDPTKRGMRNARAQPASLSHLPKEYSGQCYAMPCNTLQTQYSFVPARLLGPGCCQFGAAPPRYL